MGLSFSPINIESCLPAAGQSTPGDWDQSPHSQSDRLVEKGGKFAFSF